MKVVSPEKNILIRSLNAGWDGQIIIAFHLWLKFNPIRSTHTELSNRNNCELKDSCLPCRNLRPLADNITAK